MSIIKVIYFIKEATKRYTVWPLWNSRRVRQLDGVLLYIGSPRIRSEHLRVVSKALKELLWPLFRLSRFPIVYPVINFLILKEHLACRQGLIPLRNLPLPLFDEVDMVHLVLPSLCLGSVPYRWPARFSDDGVRPLLRFQQLTWRKWQLQQHLLECWYLQCLACWSYHRFCGLSWESHFPENLLTHTYLLIKDSLQMVLYKNSWLTDCPCRSLSSRVHHQAVH